ncbi:MAG: class I SAM-dependent methyltransferase [Acholeplasmataceae bacterium]|jgi:SAM-dependent methyltransferase|nr:class I SAM-dependent methyltransferase [Acholeplasmataceae bacterium]
MKGLPRGPHVTRYFMYRQLQSVGETLSSREGDVLAISESKKLCDVLGIKPRSLIEANYPNHNFLSLQFPDKSFDFVFSDQVLEHVEGDPQQAINESWRVLRPGGIAIHTTCFINPIHGCPSDYWRFTPEALRFLGSRFSRVLDCDGWGNFEAWFLIRDGLRFDGIPHAKWHPLHRIATRNDPEWPIVTWIVAQK